MDIKIGDFVLMETSVGQWWCEVIGIIKSETNDPKYVSRYWSENMQEWGTFHLAPETMHHGMVKEVRRLDPAIATIFKTTIKEKP